MGETTVSYSRARHTRWGIQILATAAGDAYKMASDWCTFSEALLPSCTAMASGWIDPASSHETFSGMGTVNEAGQVKY
jgi:hypothetical protein